MAAVLCLLFATRANAQVILPVNTAAGLMSALTTVDQNPGTRYEINITGNIVLTAGTTLPAINTASPLIINGNNFTVNGGGVQQGLFVYSGTVRSITSPSSTRRPSAAAAPPVGWPVAAWAPVVRFWSPAAATSRSAMSLCRTIMPPAARAGRRVVRAVVAAAWAGTAAIPVAALAAAELVVGRMAATELSALPVRPAL
jgi:hypothetical protein